MATAVHFAGLSSSVPGALDLTIEFDRVLQTAADRPLEDTLPAMADPAADHGDATLTARRNDVEAKHDRVRQYLDAHNLDAVVLGMADSVAWFTSGGDLGQDLCCGPAAIVLFVNRNCRAVIADNVQSLRVFEEELAGLGFQLKERPWHEEPFQVVKELCRNKRVASDLGGTGCGVSRPEIEGLKSLRRQLTPLERQRLRELGRTLSLAVEATCRNFDRGEREADVAGHLAHRLMREGVIPVDLRVASDDRLARFRQPTFKASPIQRRATIAVTGKRYGLCASLTRTVSFGPADPEFRADHSLATMVDATCIYFSRPGESISEVFRRARRIYEKFDHPHEWTLDYQGQIVGYSPRELVLRPDTTLLLEPDTALAWSPSVQAARTEDTVVIDGRGYEVVTAPLDWPQVDVAVKGFVIPRPGILER